MNVVGLTKVKGSSSGIVHTCAITTTGKVKCWGDNSYGQLGTNNTTASLTPMAPYNLPKAKVLKSGAFNSCVVTSKGAAKCWGYNSNGQVGNGVTGPAALAPAQVVGLTKKVKTVEVGYTHVCAIKTNGKTVCWGANGGALGNGSTTDSNTPVSVVGLAKAKDLGVGINFSCALTTSGKVRCWGYNNFGQLGNGTTTDSTVPVAVVSLP